MLLRKVTDILANDSSFADIGIRRLLLSHRRSRDLRTLSTGHKAIVNIVTQLISHLQPYSLVLFDEPESHLHPPLLSSLLQAIQLILESLDSICIVATHSPVVVQEISSDQVHLMRRVGTATRITSPPIETFGENVGTLTSEVFQLNSDLVPYVRTLRALAKKYSLAAVERIFEKPLGFQARSFIEPARRKDR